LNFIVNTLHSIRTPLLTLRFRYCFVPFPLSVWLRFWLSILFQGPTPQEKGQTCPLSQKNRFWDVGVDIFVFNGGPLEVEFQCSLGDTNSLWCPAYSPGDTNPPRPPLRNILLYIYIYYIFCFFLLCFCYFLYICNLFAICLPYFLFCYFLLFICSFFAICFCK
jgi:hypothetical protein